MIMQVEKIPQEFMVALPLLQIDKSCWLRSLFCGGKCPGYDPRLLLTDADSYCNLVDDAAEIYIEPKKRPSLGPHFYLVVI